MEKLAEFQHLAPSDNVEPGEDSRRLLLQLCHGTPERTSAPAPECPEA